MPQCKKPKLNCINAHFSHLFDKLSACLAVGVNSVAPMVVNVNNKRVIGASSSDVQKIDV